MAKTVKVWVAVIGITLIFLSYASGQRVGADSENPAICKNVVCNSIPLLENLKDCVVVLGNLHIVLMERTKTSDFKGISFPKLREVTGFVAVYRVSGLESVGQLFPNLARIRGMQLFDNYGLIVHDMPSLREVGLFSLIKIDRGGVVIWGGPHTCYVRTVDWKTIAPVSRLELMPPEMNAHCDNACNCTKNVSTNYCWNNKQCQRFLQEPDQERCHKQCLGCRDGHPDECTVCRHYTYRGRCIPSCPNDTIVLPENDYCLTVEQCKQLNGWPWNKKCVLDCPVDYMQSNDTGQTTCKRCYNCQTCQDLVIQHLNSIQQAERCVFINGSLTIHVRSIPGAMKELRTYLGRIQEVADYLVIYGSLSITSLDFLTSLRYIGGRNLKNNTYSLIIRNMRNLHDLFASNVTRNLKIERGKLKIYDNPMLCMNKIKDISRLFPVASNLTDIPPGMNGYSGGCIEASVGLKIIDVNETAATVIFTPLGDLSMQYTILYVRIPKGTHANFVPETCSESEWFAIHTEATPDQHGKVELTSLRPASTYAVCIETYAYSYEPLQTHLARSIIVNFTTSVGKPKPPFIMELVASSSEEVVLRWVDHKDYEPHITRYELDVTLIEIHENDILARNHCTDLSDIFEVTDYTRHAVLLRPPPDYERGCESLCRIHSSVTKGAVVEDHFDVCSSLGSDCDEFETTPPSNSTFGNYVRTHFLNITGPRTVFKISGLAPFRDYKFRLRACVGSNCSRSSRNVVRTLRSEHADIPLLSHYSVNEAGYVSVKWEPPDITNGPVLAYSIHVLPYTQTDNTILPQSLCVSPNTSSLVVRSQIMTKYRVRVCSSTLGSFSACGKWRDVIQQEFRYGWLWTSIFLSFSLTVISAVIGYIWNRRRDRSDIVSLVDSTATYRNESEPPSVITLTDFTPIYSMPLRDTVLH